jgi:hypothetical protein
MDKWIWSVQQQKKISQNQTQLQAMTSKSADVPSYSINFIMRLKHEEPKGQHPSRRDHSELELILPANRTQPLDATCNSQS